MAAITQRIEARVRREFAPGAAEQMLRQLEALSAAKQSPERLHAAVVLLARGDLDRAEWASKIDWRDAFVWSGLGSNWEERVDEEFGPPENSPRLG